MSLYTEYILLGPFSLYTFKKGTVHCYVDKIDNLDKKMYKNSNGSLFLV